MKKSTLLHLRIPFSFFLLPVFLLAGAIASKTDLMSAALCFVSLHFFIYPASNGYNSYFDKDEGSIGGLKEPPSVSLELYWVSLLMEGIGLLLGLFISLEFVLMIFLYGMVSKAYSHPSVRLKKYPLLGWIAAGVFQGYFTILLSVMAIEGIGFEETFTYDIQMPALLSSVLLLGSYPMTQIYQHEEDGKRGDETISRQLGILGTFHFTAVAFAIAMGGFVAFFYAYFGATQALAFPVFLSPVLGYFGLWYFKARKDARHADYGHTMRLNFISSLMLNTYFFYLWLA